ncbi:MAG: septum formation initiator [Rhodospirillales bacterium]
MIVRNNDSKPKGCGGLWTITAFVFGLALASGVVPLGAAPGFAAETGNDAAPKARQDKTQDKKKPQKKPDTRTGQPSGTFADSVTRHTVTLGGKPVDYVATAGVLTVPAERDESTQKGRMFYVAYTLDGPAAARRPVTFVFNGGPGAAAAYLHLGVMGPKRVDFAADGRVPAPPVRLIDNPQSWLAFTDLVFIDPVGTGYSRTVSGKDEETVESDGDSPFWATGRDLDALGDFIRLYLTRNKRWLSPTVLAGESYGGFRVAALADRLQTKFGISVGGLVMISPALELGLLSESRFRLLPWIIRVPSFAAAAVRHGRVRGGEDEATLQTVERFTIDALLPGLTRGGALGEKQRTDLLSRLARYTGLPEDLVIRYGGKLPGDVFAARLLEKDGRIVSMYDASISYPAPHPADGRYRDPRLARISAALTAAFNDDVRTRLKVETDLPYEVLNRRTGANWNWGRSGRSGPPGAAENLENAFKRIEGLRGLLVHGLYDLVTPYFGSAVLVNQLDLEPALRERLILRNYEGGHMFYSHAVSRAAFYDDARRLYEKIAGGKP